MNLMKSIRAYFRGLTSKDVANDAHRELVGGLWDELGHLQLEFMIRSGLRPDDTLLDIGCGCLRGGVQFIEYLHAGNYYGLDINGSLIEAGKGELLKAGLSGKNPHLIVDDGFSFGRFGTKFGFMISVSLFTHLPMNTIIRCLANARENLAPNGVYYSSFFQAPDSAHLEAIRQQPGDIITHYDSDPFHYSADELAAMAKLAGLRCEVIGEWNHPRNQKMAAFRPLR